MAQNYGLGRGLSSLIPQKKINRDADSDSSSSDDLQGVDYVKKDNYIPKREEPKKAVAESFNQGVLEVDINKIAANPYQPRIHFDEEKLKELSDSIKEHGVLQPLVVTRKGDEYELIAGERRLQASKLALLTKIPIIIKDIKDKQKLELAIVENIQRHNLNPIEEARSFQQLMDEFQMSQEEVAQKMGKSRSVVANKIRLLKLPVEALKALKDGIITEGHAKAILSVGNPEKQRALLDLTIKNNWTVRQVENKTKEISAKVSKRTLNIDPEIKDLEDRLSIMMGTKVRVKRAGGNGGRVIIDYYSNDELKKIISNLSLEKNNKSMETIETEIPIEDLSEINEDASNPFPVQP
ncbi:MAG: Chromosome (Plasmid) partitioning protein ParB / Stage 0 sporulation protein J [Candidatus Moranbacteria bacterium GW2011_GWF1_34_10]|nr:MAG: Chromosome (Plasmid) partitioning protein ParB / Stage 0 sporulation protein J [Candidatus Moranbacteria bacterium GW2011_GWF1_34_10]